MAERVGGKVDLYFFFKHSITTCKSTPLLIKFFRSLIAWLVKFIKNETVEIANFSGGIAFDFSVDVVANTVFWSHETKKLIGLSFMF